MRHLNAGRKLGMDSTARKAMIRNMVTSLLTYGRVSTTEARAKEVRRFAEKVITLGKNAPSLDGLEGEALANAKARRVHLIRQAALVVNDRAVVQKVFGEFAARFQGRNGGYTRVVKNGFRKGDNASLAILELVDNPAPVASAPAAEEAPAAE